MRIVLLENDGTIADEIGFDPSADKKLQAIFGDCYSLEFIADSVGDLGLIECPECNRWFDGDFAPDSIDLPNLCPGCREKYSC